MIGGQAVAFWADVYREELPADLRTKVLASKDIDFTAADQASVRLVATRLQGEAIFPTLDDATPNLAVVQFVDDAGKTRAVDFLESPFGLDGRAVLQRAQEFEILDDEGKGTGQTFLVMNPVHMLRSRVANVAALPQGDTPHGLAQLRAAIACCRGFVRTVLQEHGSRATLRLNEEIFGIAKSMHGITVFKKHGIDPFESVVADTRLPERFRSIRYAHMLERLRSGRSR